MTALALLISFAMPALSGCEAKGSPASPPPPALEPEEAESPDDGTHVEATLALEPEDLPRLAEGAQERLKAPIYHVHFHDTEDESTRAWVELNDLRDEELDGVLEHAAQYSEGQIIVPPGAPGVPKRYGARERYTVAALDDPEGAFSSRAIGFTYYKGPSENHFIAVTKPERKLERETLYVAVPGQHDALSLTSPRRLAPDEEAFEPLLKGLHAHLDKTLLKPERASLPGALSASSVALYQGDFLPAPHVYLASVDITLDEKDEAADHITALVLLDERYEVSGMIEAPAKRIDTFSVKGIVQLKEGDDGVMLYESLQYEGAYLYLIAWPQGAERPDQIMLSGDGL